MKIICLVTLFTMFFFKPVFSDTLYFNEPKEILFDSTSYQLQTFKSYDDEWLVLVVIEDSTNLKQYYQIYYSPVIIDVIGSFQISIDTMFLPGKDCIYTIAGQSNYEKPIFQRSVSRYDQDDYYFTLEDKTIIALSRPVEEDVYIQGVERKMIYNVLQEVENGAKYIITNGELSGNPFSYTFHFFAFPSCTTSFDLSCSVEVIQTNEETFQYDISYKCDWLRMYWPFEADAKIKYTEYKGDSSQTTTNGTSLYRNRRVMNFNNSYSDFDSIIIEVTIDPDDIYPEENEENNYAKTVVVKSAVVCPRKQTILRSGLKEDPAHYNLLGQTLCIQKRHCAGITVNKTDKQTISGMSKNGHPVK